MSYFALYLPHPRCAVPKTVLKPVLFIQMNFYFSVKNILKKKWLNQWHWQKVFFFQKICSRNNSAPLFYPKCFIPLLAAIWPHFYPNYKASDIIVILKLYSYHWKLESDSLKKVFLNFSHYFLFCHSFLDVIVSCKRFLQIWFIQVNLLKVL